MRAAEGRAIQAWGMPSLVLQEHAALGALALLPPDAPLLILAGPGNNGGDALVMARLASLQGRKVGVWAPEGATWRGDAAHQARLWEGLGGTVDRGDFAPLLAACRGWVVDGLFGLGATRPLDGSLAEAVRALNASGLPVLALDLPSGLDPSSGDVPGPAVRATRTACFGALKICHGLLPAQALCGDITVVPIPLDAPPTGELGLLEKPDLPPRPWDAHKGHYGHVAIRAGSLGMSGAAVLAALGALRAGAGLVTVLTDAAVRGEVASQVPEAMVRAWDGTVPEGAEVLLVGPGGVADIPAWGGPLVLDASALQEGQGAHWLQRPDTVITPHPGEFARLFGLPKPMGTDARLAQARQVAAGAVGVLLLKGAQSLVAGGGDPSLGVNPTGNPGMATGGSGDLLAGMVASFRAQGLSMRAAAATAAWFHGAAADAVAGPGLLPRDMADQLPGLLRG